MLTENTSVFLKASGQSDENTMHPGKVITANQNTCTIEFEEHDLGIAIDQELLIFYELKQKFMRQAARVESFSNNEPNIAVVLHTTGEPMLSESRQCYRVSTVSIDISVKLGSETDCTLRNIRAIGLAVIATKRYEVGQIVNVEIYHEGKKIAGRTNVASVTNLKNGRTRYGLLCVDDRKTNGELMKGLAQMNVALQRLQLRRLAQAG